MIRQKFFTSGMMLVLILPLLIASSAIKQSLAAGEFDITTGNLPNAAVDEAYNQQLEGNFDTVDPVTWSLIDGSLPRYISLSADGLISGTPTKYGVYTFYVQATDGTTSDTKKFSIRVDSPLAYPSGSLIRKKGATRIYILKDYRLHAFNGMSAFYSHGYRLDQIVDITQAELDIYRIGSQQQIRNGTLLKRPEKSTIFLVDSGKKHKFPSNAIFDAWGYNRDGILDITQKELYKIPYGKSVGTYSNRVIKGSGSTLYLVAGSKKRRFPDNRTFIGMGYTQSDVETVTDLELDSYPNGPPIRLVHPAEGVISIAKSNDRFKLESVSGKLVRRKFPSKQELLSNGYNTNLIATVTLGELKSYPLGSKMGHRDGTLITSSSYGRYIIDHGNKRKFPTTDDFLAMRFLKSNIIKVSDSLIVSLSSGAKVIADEIKLAELAARRNPHSSKVVSGWVGTPVGSYSYQMVKATRSGTEVKTVSGVDYNCTNNCTAKPLANYVNANSGFAGIHGSYFCPPDYDCGGKYKYDSPLFDTNYNKWIWWEKRIWAHRGALSFDGETYYSYWPGEDAERHQQTASIFNYPMLVYNGNVVANASNTDDKQRTAKATRGAIGYNDNYIFLVKVNGATVIDTAYVMKALGAKQALNLDGGGSTALYYKGNYLAGPGRLLPNAVVLVKK